MSEELRQELYEAVLAYPGDTALVSQFVIAQAKAIHNSRGHQNCGSYGRANFYECGVRWCRAARRIAGVVNPLAATPEPAQSVSERWMRLAETRRGR